MAILLFGTYAVVLAGTTYQRNKDWKDEFTFWSKAAELPQNSYKTNNSLGVLYYKKGGYTEAYKYLTEALSSV